MDVLRAIQTRRSIRAYAPREVENEKLVRILESARLSPSAGNRQERRFIVIAACSVESEYIMRKSLDEIVMEDKWRI